MRQGLPGAVKRMEWEALEDAGLDDEVELLLERY